MHFVLPSFILLYIYSCTFLYFSVQNEYLTNYHTVPFSVFPFLSSTVLLLPYLIPPSTFLYFHYLPLFLPSSSTVLTSIFLIVFLPLSAFLYFPYLPHTFSSFPFFPPSFSSFPHFLLPFSNFSDLSQPFSTFPDLSVPFLTFL